MEKINWTVSIVVGALLTIPFGIIANLLSERVDRWLFKKAIIFRGKLATQIKKDYEKVKLFHKSPLLLQLLVNDRIIMSFIVIMIFIMTSFLFLLTYFLLPSNLIEWRFLIIPMIFIVILITFFNYFLLMRTSKQISRVIGFDEYGKHIVKQLNKLKQPLKK